MLSTSSSFTSPAPRQSIAPPPKSGSSDKSAGTGKVDRLELVPSRSVEYTAEWLAERDRLNLMQTSRRYNGIMQEFYKKGLNPDVTKVARPADYAREYRDPKQRDNRHIFLDCIGHNYLNTHGISFPLTEKIRDGKLTLAEAVKFADRQRSALQSAMTSGHLSERTQHYLRNPLFAEHVTSGRCDIETAVRLARNGRNVFYSMTLQSLFRSGRLVPADLEILSDAGIQFVHDPLLVGLLQDDLISRADVLKLTRVQVVWLTICRPLLLNKKLTIQSVLALNPDQLRAMQKHPGLLDDLHAGRKTLASALKSIEPKSESSMIIESAPGPARFSARSGSGSQSELSNNQTELRLNLLQTSTRSIHDAICDGDLDGLIKEIGKGIHLLPTDLIIQHLDTSNVGYDTAFEELCDGLRTMEGEELAMDYIQIYLNLEDHLSSHDYIRVAKPFLQNVFGLFMAEAYAFNFDQIIDQCCRFWSIVRSKCVMSGTPLDPLRALIMPMLKRECSDQDLLYCAASPKCIASYGRLLTSLGMLGSELNFNLLNGSTEVLETQYIETASVDSFHALCSAFESTTRGAGFLAVLGEMMQQRNTESQ